MYKQPMHSLFSTYILELSGKLNEFTILLGYEALDGAATYLFADFVSL